MASSDMTCTHCSQQVLALTFDDGPHPSSLPAVLDVLKAQGVPATFFVNTYAASDWLGPFSSAGNQVRAVCLKRDNCPAGRPNLGQLANAVNLKRSGWLCAGKRQITTHPVVCRQGQAVDPSAVTRTACRLH